MSWSTRRARAHLSLLAVFVATAAAAGAGAASASSAHGSKHLSCVTVDGNLEQTIKYSSIGTVTPPMSQIGDTAVYYDDIFAPDGTTLVGNAVGYVTLVSRAANGDLLADYSESVQLPQGTFRDVGFNEDRTTLVDGGFLNFVATGTGGQFAGKIGYRRWALQPPLSVPPVPSEKALVEISLCG